MITLHLKNNGSELIPQNVKIDLKIDDIPSELIYGLWSVTVGNRSIVGHPLHVDNAYTHLPDFHEIEALEILALAIIHVLMTEKKNNYTDGRVGFTGLRRIFSFGRKELTRGAMSLITRFKHLQVGDSTLWEVFELLKNGIDLDKNVRTFVRDEIAMRLELLGYFDFVPIPF